MYIKYTKGQNCEFRIQELFYNSMNNLTNKPLTTEIYDNLLLLAKSEDELNITLAHEIIDLYYEYKDYPFIYR